METSQLCSGFGTKSSVMPASCGFVMSGWFTESAFSRSSMNTGILGKYVSKSQYWSGKRSICSCVASCFSAFTSFCMICMRPICPCSIFLINTVYSISWPIVPVGENSIVSARIHASTRINAPGPRIIFFNGIILLYSYK